MNHYEALIEKVDRMAVDGGPEVAHIDDHKHHHDPINLQLGRSRVTEQKNGQADTPRHHNKLVG